MCQYRLYVSKVCANNSIDKNKGFFFPSTEASFIISVQGEWPPVSLQNYHHTEALT